MITFYRQSPSVFIINDSPSNPAQYYCNIKGNNLQIYTAGSIFKLHDSPYSEYEKLNGDPYESLVELTSAIENFTNSPASIDFVLQFTSPSFTPINGTTYYFSGISVTSTVNNKILTIPINCTLLGCNITTVSEGSCTQEPVNIYLRVNNTTDILLTNTITFSTVGGLNTNFYSMALSANLTAGDFYEIKAVSPTWATSPTNIIYTIQLYFKLR